MRFLCMMYVKAISLKYIESLVSIYTNCCRESEKRQKKKLLLDYLYANLKNHNFWAYRYFFCEFLGLVNIFGKQELIVLIFFASLWLLTVIIPQLSGLSLVPGLRLVCCH